MAIEKLQISKCIKKDRFCSPMFMNMSTFSPYMGCSHNCIYCDGRAEKYYFEGDFSRDIKVRENLPELLGFEIKKIREKAPIHLSSGISDVYQHIEKKLYLTGECSEILSEYNFPVSVLTKSSLILRDLENWTKVNENGGFTLQITVNTLKDEVRRDFEPGASPVEERLEVIKEFKKAGCGVGVYMQPLLPGISDDIEGTEKLITTLQDLKVDYIMPWFLTLRPGRQKDLYIEKINRDYSHLSPLYRELYRENRISGAPVKSYEGDFLKSIGSLLEGTPYLPPHSLFRNSMPKYCEVLMVLEHMEHLYRERDIDTSRLKSGTINFRQYLIEEKKRFNRRSTLPGDEIDHRLDFIISNGELNSIIKNSKLSDFIIKIFRDRKILDYRTLKLV